MSKVARHIVIYGPPGSGKSTLAKQISQRIGVPHVELDAIFWQPGWVESPLEEFRADVSAALDKCDGGWVCDGNYRRVRDIILPRADIVVWLRPPFSVAYWRLLKRTIANCWHGKLLWGTNRESWRENFFSHKSILVWQATNWRAFGRIGKDIEAIPHRATVIQLRSQKEIDAFLRELK